jgi:hypothetical protein
VIFFLKYHYFFRGVNLKIFPEKLTGISLAVAHEFFSAGIAQAEACGYKTWDLELVGTFIHEPDDPPVKQEKSGGAGLRARRAPGGQGRPPHLIAGLLNFS